MVENLYGLIDAARDERLYDWIAAEPDHACLFAGELDPELRRAAPHIVRLAPGSDFLARWHADGRGRSWGIQCLSARPLAEVRRHFRHFLQARLPSGQTILFRFYDPRVWRIYLPTCTAEELARWFSGIAEYRAEAEDEAGLIGYRLRGGALQTDRL